MISLRGPRSGEAASVMEQPNALLDKDNIELFSCLEDGNVVLAAGWGSNVLRAGPCSAEDVVNKRELVVTLKLARHCFS
jgi:hypothetical protein